MVQAKGGERGATLLMVTFLTAFLLVPIIGICMDGAVIYWVKARLSSAVDATALSTARAFNLGEGDAEALGQSYFTANFPPGMMKTTLVGSQPTINVDDSVPRRRTVTVSASVIVPLYFMQTLGFKNQTVSATGQATRRDANIILVLDRSGSMNNNGSCSSLVGSAQNFVSQFVDGRDQLGLVTYQFTANVDFSPQLYFKTALNSTLGSLVCTGDTNTVEGLYNGWDQLANTINQPGALNVIVLFTDGQANAFVGNFEIKDQQDMRYAAYPTYQNGAWVYPIVSTPPSSCSGSGPLTGVFGDASAENASDIYTLNQTGYTGGISPNTPVPITQATAWTTINAPGCSFSQNQDAALARQDIKGLPTQDIHGNSTVDGGYLPLDYFAAGTPFAGYIRPDMPRDARWAAMNAADSMAQKIRYNTTYNTVVYTIGLQGNEPMAIDQDFMERLANDPRASNFDSTRPQGRFILANNPSELSQAFQQVAWEILRLSK